MHSTHTTVVLTLSALTLAACSADMGADLLGPAAALSAFDAASAFPAAASQPALPFHGAVETTETHTITDSGIFLGHVIGSGTATQLGRFTLDDHEVGNPATLAGEVTITLTAGNGDVLTATGTAQATPGAGFLTLTNIETATITGGTGRFAGATGSFVMERVVDIAAGSPYPSTGTFTGSITLAH